MNVDFDFFAVALGTNAEKKNGLTNLGYLCHVLNLMFLPQVWVRADGRLRHGEAGPEMAHRGPPTALHRQAAPPL